MVVMLETCDDLGRPVRNHRRDASPTALPALYFNVLQKKWLSHLLKD